MAIFAISALVVLILSVVLYRVLRPAQKAWMPADAQLQLHREIRRPPRIPFHTSVTIKGHSGQESIAAESQDLAIGGMLIKPSVPLAIGQPIQVAFTLREGVSIDIPSVVCRAVGACYGIRFDVTDRQRHTIGEWVEQNRGAASLSR